MYTKEQSLAVLRQHVGQEHLIKHALMVGAALKHYANIYGEEAEYWQAVGLLHDVDFEQYPDEHPLHTAEILQPLGYGEQFIEDILSHARDYAGVRSLLQKVLLACDEMTGFVAACALVRPDKSLDNLEVKSVLKKMKDKAFARAVNRETLAQGAEMLGITLEQHIENVRGALIKLNQETT